MNWPSIYEYITDVCAKPAISIKRKYVCSCAYNYVLTYISHIYNSKEDMCQIYVLVYSLQSIYLKQRKRISKT